MNTKNICYTGIGSKKNGEHTEEEYLKIMNKNFKQKCSSYIKSLKCKPCKKSIEINGKEIIKQLKAQSKKKTYKMSKKTEEKLLKQMSKCERCKNKNTKKCKLENYLLFSGAELGECKN
jgi:hypothetical protein